MHPSPQLEAFWYLPVGGRGGGHGSEHRPRSSAPGLEQNPCANWGFPVLMCLRSAKGRVDGGEELYLHCRKKTSRIKHRP